jgi:periplasmic protein TonB
MKTKNQLRSPVDLRPLFIFPVIILLMAAFGSCASGKKTAAIRPPVSDEQEPYVVVEEMPMFPGGDSALLSYIAENTKYPPSAKTKGIQGKVIVRFCVTKTGNTDRVTILKSISTDLDAEAIRVINTLPPFKPGKQGGKDVAVWYMVPITFALK